MRNASETNADTAVGQPGRATGPHPRRHHGARSAYAAIMVSIAVGAVTAAALLAACTTKIAGTPLPTPTISATSGGASAGRTDVSAAPDETATTPAAGDSHGSGTADLRPCTLLTSAEQARLQIGASREKLTGSERLCEYTESGNFALAVGIVDEHGLTTVHSASPTRSLTIGAHDARQATDGNHGCAVILGVTDTSRVDVITAAASEPQACAIAQQVATLVEPKLP
jgi:uncharacterized protein DUF3558